MARKKQKPAPVPVPDAPLPAELLTAPQRFGQKLALANAQAWHYWPAPVVAALLGGLAYALLMRPGLNLAAEAVKTAGGASVAPTVLSHVANAFGTFFLTTLTFLVMWGLGRVGAGVTAARAKVPEVYSATFTLLIPLYLLVIGFILVTPAGAWALNPTEVSVAQGQALDLQRAALRSAARTPAALAFILVTLLGTAGQFALALPAFRATTGNEQVAWRGVLFPLLPALLLQFLGVAALVLAR